MITLQGKSYYEITELDPEREGYTINPFNADGTLIPRIQVNFRIEGIEIFTLPSLDSLNGNWNIEIIVSVSIPETPFKGGVRIVTQGFVNNSFGSTSSLGYGQSVSFKGASPTSYIATGVFNPSDRPIPLDPDRNIIE